MPQMCVTIRAGNFGSLHEQLVIRSLDDCVRCQGAKKAGPPSTRIKLGLRVEERRATASASECAAGLWKIVVAECRFRAAFSCDFVGQRR